ncbi:hypothetical protein G4B88_019774 [Cannabis sativa]|uniref:RNase H type-1 domain-containing protein n=1 Tax=Cannabis sativa TaxID=3483 RepID=A0A7J6HS00_CANSA|nr:hypothetical protein G4B88_019774 [Cannabis sativa]
MLVYAGVIMESIWKHRNMIIHSTGPLQSIESIRLEVCRRFSELDPGDGHLMQSATISTNPLLFPRLSTKHCLLVDGSFQAGSFGYAMLSPSRCSSDWWTGVSSGSCNSALEAEMLAIIQGLRWAIQNRLDDLTIISDSKVVVDAVCTRRAPEWISTATFTWCLKRAVKQQQDKNH